LGTARYDKYDPISGGFRARLAADWEADDGVPIGVGLDVDGHVVPGAGNTGVVAVVNLVKFHVLAGQVVDCMTSGDIVDCEGLDAGKMVFADDTDGTLSHTGGAGMTAVGFTVEADRLVVRNIGRDAEGS